MVKVLNIYYHQLACPLIHTSPCKNKMKCSNQVCLRLFLSLLFSEGLTEIYQQSSSYDNPLGYLKVLHLRIAIFESLFFSANTEKNTKSAAYSSNIGLKVFEPKIGFKSPTLVELYL